MIMEELRYISKIGREIEELFEQLATLRMTVFRDFPYLYEGTLDYELEYLKTYSNSDRALLFSVFDGDEMVGATTCIPLEDEFPEIKQPFQLAGIDVKSVFYFGESILLPKYRGKKIGHRFFGERENHAKSFGTFHATCFCSVLRPENHPLKPQDYRSNDVFWQKRGYEKQSNLICSMSWLDIGEKESTSKNLEFWMKNID